jgi:hypothetical protein
VQVEEGAGAGRPHPCAPWPWPRRPVGCACSRASPPTVMCRAGLEPCTCFCRSVRANDPNGRTPARPGLRPHRVNAPRAPGDGVAPRAVASVRWTNPRTVGERVSAGREEKGQKRRRRV